MKIIKRAIAGTLESSDAQVIIEPNDAGIVIDLESPVINQFGKQIKNVIRNTLEHLDIQDCKIKVFDQGALDCTLKARIEAAAFRSIEQTEDIPWGKGVRP